MPDMLLITDLTVEAVPRMWAEVMVMPDEVDLMSIPLDAEVAYETEQVVAEFFRDHNGKEVRIGMTQKVRDVLGLPLGCFEEQWKEIGRLKASEKHQRQVASELLAKVSSLTLWQRIKVLFGANPAYMNHPERKPALTQPHR